MLNSTNCRLCPRECGIDRTRHVGKCKSGDSLLAARASLHFWEEPCISGSRGSGTVFFSGCSLGCVYCQNQNISAARVGREITHERLAEIFFELQSKGAHNINLVTPDHFAPHIKKAILLSRKRGFDLPFVYNTSGYCSVDTLRGLCGLIDVYLCDFKYFSADLAKKYSSAENYPAAAAAALAEMHRQVPSPLFDDDGIMQRGIIVRHLLLPGNLEDSKNVLSYLHSSYGDSIYVSIMNQYTPPSGAELPRELSRRVTKLEYARLCEFAIALGIKNAFVQEGGTAMESFIPDFDLSGI